MTGLNSLFINSSTLSGFYTETNREKQSERTLNQQQQMTAALQKHKCSIWMEIAEERSAHLGQLVEFDCLLKQALVLGL